MRRTSKALLRYANPSGLACLLLLCAVWEGLARTNIGALRFLPTPVSIASHAGMLISDTNLPANVLHTIVIACAGWAVASVAGLTLGTAIGVSDLLWRWSIASIDALRSLPIVALLPIAVLLLGLSTKMEFVFVMYAAFWPVVVSTIAGLQVLDPALSEVSATLGLNRRKHIWKVMIPGAMVAVAVGMRLGLSIALVMAVVAEMLANPTGLGYQLVREQLSVEPALMFGYLIVIGAVGVVLNAAFRVALRIAMPGVAGLAGNEL